LLWWLRTPSPPSPRRGRNQRPREEVIADIVATAIALADRDGVDALSMRRVASELGVGTMSLYWYLESKDDLLDLVFDALLDGVILDDDELTDWSTGLTAIAQRTRAVFLDHPWLVTIGGLRPALSPNILRHVDQSFALVDGLGLDRRSQEIILQTVDDYIIGHVTRQITMADVRRRWSGDEPHWLEVARAFVDRFAASEHLQHLRDVLADRRPDDDLFLDGLAVVLAGVAATYGLEL
jgi:AcrR family transcriptional regulator